MHIILLKLYKTRHTKYEVFYTKSSYYVDKTPKNRGRNEEVKGQGVSTYSPERPKTRHMP